MKKIRPKERDMLLDSDDSIESMFKSQEFAQQNDIKELFHEDKTKARTDLSARQISLIARAYYLCDIMDMPEITKLLNTFITLRISKDRKSRLEFVEGLKSRLDNQANMNNLNVRGQFGK